MFRDSRLVSKQTLLGVLRKAAREATAGGQVDLREFEPILTDWAEKRPLQRTRVLELISIANGDILGGRHDAALKAFREAIRIVERTRATDTSNRARSQ
jgi:hypothetical protein